jgi:hypothetical protein
VKTTISTTYAFAVHRAISSSSPDGQPTPGPLLSRHRSLELAMRRVQLLRVPVVILDANGEIVEQTRALDHTERLILKQRETLRNLPRAFFERHGVTKDLNLAYFRFPTKSKWREFQNASGYACYGMDNGRNVFALLPHSPFSMELVKLAIRFGATIVDLERQQDLLRLFYFIEDKVS